MPPAPACSAENQLICSRSRRHTVDELTEEITGILSDFTSHTSAAPVFSYENLCRQALMAEVSATPKPGLVDRHDNGAHNDMNFQTFAVSTEAIVPYLNAMYQAGEGWTQAQRKRAVSLYPPHRRRGRKIHVQATNVNTHKGMIFLWELSLLPPDFIRNSAIQLRFLAEDILKLAGQICRDEIEKDFDQIRSRSTRLMGNFKRYNMKGIRGRAKVFPLSPPSVFPLSGNTNPKALVTMLLLLILCWL